MSGGGAWVNTTFRREGGELLASDLIRLAVAHTRAEWPDVPNLGMVSFVDPSKVRHKRDPGRCYRKAGFPPGGDHEGRAARLAVAARCDARPIACPVGPARIPARLGPSGVQWAHIGMPPQPCERSGGVTDERTVDAQ